MTLAHDKKSGVRTRFAPSPTGVLHVGSVRTALFCWLFARRHGGQFILRIEDTDRERSTTENVEAILDGMNWLRLGIDEGPFYQTDRFDRYSEIIDLWLAQGKAYRCYCSKKELDSLRERQMAAGERIRYDGRCRTRKNPKEGVEPVVRFKNPRDGQVFVNDAVRKQVIFDNAQLDDLIIARSDGTPTYNFTVVVDDCDMGITHVIRGDDHLNNTPRQMNMLHALGVKAPVYAHLPMILGADGAKLSKRHGAVDIREYREQGYLPQAMLNYLARLGWSHGDQEIFSVDELIRYFDIADVNQSASSFNPDKLRWLNQQHIIATPVERLGEMIKPFLVRLGFDLDDGPDPAHIAQAFHERAETLLDMAESARYCFEEFDPIEASLVKRYLRPVALEPMRALRDRLADLDAWTTTRIASAIQEVAVEFDIGFGKLGQPVRVAVTGGAVSPPIDITLWIVGQQRSLRRLDVAIGTIERRISDSKG